MISLLALVLGLTPIVVMSGQSLAMGGSTVAAISTAQTLDNRMVGGATVDSTGALYVPPYAWPLVPLVESGAYETPRSGLANMYATTTGNPLVVVSGARGGMAYSGIKKGTLPYSYLEVSLEAIGSHIVDSYVLASTMTHGESDQSFSMTRAQYKAVLVEFQADVQAKARTTTPRTGDRVVPLYIDQLSSATKFTGATDPTVVMGQWEAARDNPGVVILACPKYFLPYVADGIHLTAAGSRTLGAYLGRAIAVGPGWRALQPVSAVRTGDVIHVEFHVPAPPLVLDTVTVSDPGNYGFEVTGGGSIVSVALGANGASVDITVSGAVTLLRYAYTGTVGAAAGPTTGQRGCLRDSDTATFEGVTLRNWAVHSEVEVTS